MPSAVMAAILNVIFFRHWREQGCASVHLADPAQNNLCSPLVQLYWSMDFNAASRKSAHVAHISKIVRENHHRKRTGHLVFAEVEEVHAFRSFHAQDCAGHALVFADMSSSFLEGNAVRSS